MVVKQSIIKPEYIKGIFKITRSRIVTLSPRQQAHISNQSLKVNDKIYLDEEQFGKVFQGRYIVYFLGMYDTKSKRLAIEQFVHNPGW